MKRRSFLSVVLAAFIPTSLITSETSEPPQTIDIAAHIEDEFGPYLVSGTIKDTKTGAVTTLNQRVTSGFFGKRVTVKSGHHVTIDLSVTASRSGSSTGFLSINDRVARINGDQRVMICNFVA